MATSVLRSGKFAFRPIPDWGQSAGGWPAVEAAGLAGDSQDNVVVFARSAPQPVIVLDAQGKLLSSWGQGLFQMAHGICVGPDNYLYLTDVVEHTVKKLSPNGELIFVLGTPGKTGGLGQPFNRPTSVAVAPSGELYVSDGYGSWKIHRYSPDGKLLQSWGEPGHTAGEFHIPHGIRVDRNGRVYVCDRENHRVQVFTPDGEFLTQWSGFIRPTDIVFDAEDRAYVIDLGEGYRQRRGLGGLTILSLDGEMLARFGGEANRGLLTIPHRVWVDSHGDVYIAESLQNSKVQKLVRVA